MSRIERIKKIIEFHLKPNYFIIKDRSKLHKGHSNFDGLNETHLYIEIYSELFKEKKTLEIHRKINKILEKEFDNGLHALEIKIKRN